MKRADLVILIVDDDLNDRAMFERAFRKNGVQGTIRSVESVAVAMAYLHGEDQYADRVKFPFPSLLITDLKMPREDGFAFLQQIKSNPQGKMIPILVMSGAVDADDVKRCYTMGASCYLEKPGNPDELCRVLKLFYDFWRECHVPQIDTHGVQISTEHRGKLGARFGPMT